MLHNFWIDECGFVISTELVLVLTIAVLSMVVGLSEVATAVVTELNDVSNAIGALNQSFAFAGFVSNNGKPKGFIFGSRFTDDIDDCDKNTTCDLVGPLGVACDEANAGIPGAGGS